MNIPNINKARLADTEKMQIYVWAGTILVGVVSNVVLGVVPANSTGGSYL